MDTVPKTRFFDAKDGREDKPKALVYREQKVTKNTAEAWQRDRKKRGDLAYRHTRKLSDKLGRRRQLTPPLFGFRLSPLMSSPLIMGEVRSLSTSAKDRGTSFD